MKTITLTIVLILVLHALACGALQRPAATPQPTPSNVVVEVGENRTTPEMTAALKSVLFADEPPDKLTERIQRDSPGTDEEPWRSFAQSAAHSRQGKVEEAKKDLRRVLSLPEINVETRVLLSAWTGLRALGERPPAGEADKVQGVVCELHNEAGVGTLAAYADGRARWLGGQGAVSLWEAPGSDKEIDGLINDLLKSVEPHVKRAPAAERRMPAEIEREHFRVTILTFGGLHVIDIYGPDIDGKANYLAPTLMASVGLLDAIKKREPAKGQ